MPETTTDPQALRRLAEAVREACVTEAVDAYEQGGMSGLCVEGRWDLAMDRLRHMDVERLIAAALEQPEGP